METSFCSKEMKQFFDIMHKPTRSGEDVLVNVRLALSCMEGCLGIGKVHIDFSAPKTKLRPQSQNFSGILYQREEACACHPITYSFRTGDGGQVVLTIYAMDGHEWEPEELEELKIISNVIFNAFKIENMNIKLLSI